MKKISNLVMFVFMLFLVMFFNASYCEANENLTLTKFKEIVKADGYNMDNVTFPSYFNQLLNNNPIIFYNQDKTKIMCFTGVVKANAQKDYYPNITLGIYNNRYVIGYQYKDVKTYNMKAGYYAFEGYNIIDTDTYPNRYRIGCSINLSDYSFETISSGSNGYNYYSGQVYPYIGYDYSYYQNDYTLDNFKTLSFIKSKLANNIIFCGKSLYYSDNDIFYKFDGVIQYYPKVISGDIVKWKVNGTVTADDVNLVFNYSPNYDVSNGVLNFVVDLEELAPSEVIKQDDYYGYTGSYTRLFSSDIDNFKYSDLTNYNVKYNDLIKKMKEGYIYRLRFYVEQFNNRTNMVSLYYDISTSCYFSLNDWKSSSYTIKNIYKLFSSASGIEIIPGDSSSDKDGDLSIKDLNNNIENTILGTPNESGERQGGLVGNLLEGLWKGLVALIIPDADTFGKWITDQTYKLSNNSGFLTYSKNFWVSMLNLITNSEEKDFILVLPAFKLPTGISSITIWEEQRLNLTAYFKNNENETIKSFYTIYIVLVSGISIYMFCQYLWSLWDSIITGVSTITPQDDGAIDSLESYDMDTGEHTVTYSGRSGHRRYRLKENLTKEPPHRRIGL